MIIAVVKIKIYIPWVHSLKEKRMEVKSICSRVRNKFNVSISEVGDQDLHQSIELGFASISGLSSQADSIIDNVINFIERNTEGEIIHVQRELL